MRLQVTAEDIRLGVPCHGSRCPVALALRRKLKVQTVQARIGRLDVCVARRTKQTKDVPSVWYQRFERYEPSADANAFMAFFDEGAPVEPQVLFFKLEDVLWDDEEQVLAARGLQREIDEYCASVEGS